MVTLHSNGITVTVPKAEAYIYIRAGYKVVEVPAEKPVKAEKPTKGEK